MLKKLSMDDRIKGSEKYISNPVIISYNGNEFEFRKFKTPGGLAVAIPSTFIPVIYLYNDDGNIINSVGGMISNEDIECAESIAISFLNSNPVKDISQIFSNPYIIDGHPELWDILAAASIGVTVNINKGNITHFYIKAAIEHNGEISITDCVISDIDDILARMKNNSAGWFSTIIFLIKYDP